MTKKKKESEKKKAGRKTGWNDQMRARLEMLSRKGFTDDEMAFAVGVTSKTIQNWRNKHPEFFLGSEAWKAEPNAKVKRCLYERACGYSHAETKVYFDKDGIVQRDKDGNLIYDNRFATIQVLRHYPPETRAIEMWLYNRDPKNWRRFQKEDTEASTGNIQITVVRDGDNKKDS